jgi:hypothetical protein
MAGTFSLHRKDVPLSAGVATQKRTAASAFKKKLKKSLQYKK